MVMSMVSPPVGSVLGDALDEADVSGVAGALEATADGLAWPASGALVQPAASRQSAAPASTAVSRSRGEFHTFT